jgi:TolA-binding protein
MNLRYRALLGAVALAIIAAPAYAQQSSTVTQADVQRLQDNVYLADRDLSQLRSRDATRATQLGTELDDLRDEVVYLKVKLRKERTLSRTEYADVRDRIEDLRSRARSDVAAAAPASTPTPAPAPAPSSSAASSATTASRSTSAPGNTTSTPSTTTTASRVEVPVGTEIDVRLQNTLNSGTAQVEDRFEGTTLADVTVDGRLAIPAGSIFRGVVTAVEPGTRTNRTSKMTVSFDQVTLNGRSYPIRGTVTQAIEGEGIRGEAGRTAAGAGVGAIIGGILGGFKGALAGILIGGGGTIAATEGKEVELPQGSVLRVRMDSPVQIDTQTRH